MSAGPRDAREDNRIVLGAMALLGGVLSLLAALQAVFALGMLSRTLRGVDPGPLLDVTTRVLVNVSTIGLAIALVAVLRPERSTGGGRVARTAVIAVGMGLVRCCLQVLTGVYPLSALPALAVELVVGSTVIALITAYGYLLVRAARRVREKEREHARASVQALEAVQALQREELRVRRDVAQSMHGGLQNGLVVLTAELHAVANTSDEAASERLLAIAARLDRLREDEVRAVGHALYPVEIDHGLVPAVRDLVARLPPEIAVDLDLGRIPALAAEGAEPPLDQRMLLVRFLEEAVTQRAEARRRLLAAGARRRGGGRRGAHPRRRRPRTRRGVDALGPGAAGAAARGLRGLVGALGLARAGGGAAEGAAPAVRRGRRRGGVTGRALSPSLASSTGRSEGRIHAGWRAVSSCPPLTPGRPADPAERR
jgi:signal transduction histidine kinase